MAEDEDEPEVGTRWREYKKESWSRAGLQTGAANTGSVSGGWSGDKYNIDDKMADPNFEWWSSSAGQTEYFDNLDQQYTYFCYGENDYEACQKRAEFLRTFRRQYKQSEDEFIHCCEKFRTPGCCFQAAQNVLFKPGVEKKEVEKSEMAKYWEYNLSACWAPDYPRSKQQQGYRAGACLGLAQQVLQFESDWGALESVKKAMPPKVRSPAFLTELFKNVEKSCNIPQLGEEQRQSCLFAGTALLNTRYGKKFHIQSDPLKGIDYLKMACDGNGPALGVKTACDNLAKIYKRGNSKFGIEPDGALSDDYKRKGYLCTDKGKQEVSMKNMPKMGQMMS